MLDATRSVYTCSHNPLLPVCCFRGGRKRKTMKLSRDLSNLVVFTNSVASQECLTDGKIAYCPTRVRAAPERTLFPFHVSFPSSCRTCALPLGTLADVLSFSEARAQSLVNHKAEQFLSFNQRQLSRIYPSAYRIDSSNFNPQFYWNVGCQLGETIGASSLVCFLTDCLFQQACTQYLATSNGHFVIFDGSHVGMPKKICIVCGLIYQP